MTFHTIFAMFGLNLVQWAN